MAAETHVNSEQTENNEEKSKRKVKQTVLDNFSKIIHTNEKIRVKSGLNLLSHLAETKENEKDETELKYALGRIIRGLGSSTNQARTGFYTALVGLISLREDVTVSDIFEQVEKQLHKVGSNTKGENADIYSGQILVCGAIIRSDLYFRSDVDDQKKVVELLLTAGKERTYLTLVSYIFILNLIEKVSDKEAEKVLLPLVRPEFSKSFKEFTLDSLYLLLSIQKYKPSLIKPKVLRNALGSETVICEENLSQLSNIVTTIPRVTSLSHPVYELLAETLSPSVHLSSFFTELDQHLNRPNRNKHLAITRLFSNILDSISNFEVIPLLLTDNFIKQTINYFKSFTKYQKDLEFQKHMHEFFDKLIATLKKDGVSSSTKVCVLKRLLFNPGTFIFEKITKSKIIQHITHSLDSDGVKELSSVYSDVVTGKLQVDIGANTNENLLNNDRLYAAHLMVKLLNLPAVQKQNDWKIEKLSFLMTLGIFKKEGLSNVGCELAASLKDTFYGALDLKSSKLEDVQIILSQLVKNLDSKISEDNLETVLRSPITKENYETWQKTLQIITKIEKKKKRSHGIKSVFLTLFLHMELQLINDPKLATETLNELFNCYDRVRKNRKNSLNETDLNETVPDVQENDNDPLWIEVVVDLFLNLLSHNSHLLRSLIGNVFPHLCSYLNATAIHQILSVLDPKNDSNPLSKDSDDSDSEEEESESDDDEEEESKSEDDEDEELQEDEKTTDKLRMALHKALSSSHQDDDQESIDLDQISDTEGEKLDEALAEVFKQFKPNRGKSRKQNKDAETLTHFRIRVLDLIEIYLDSTPNMLLTLEIMLPLLQAVEFSIRDEHQKPLHNRLKAILKKLTSIKKFESTEGVTDAVLSDLLKSLLEKGTKNSIIIQEMGEQISECCIFLIKCSQIIVSIEDTPKKVKKQLKHISGIISEELNSYFTKRDCLTPYVLFKNALNLSWDGSLVLAKGLLSFIFNDEIKPFKKSQALELLKIFFTNQRYLSTKSEKIKNKLADDVEKFTTDTNDFLKNLCTNPSENKVKEKFLCNLFSVLTSIKSSPLKFETIEWSDLATNVREYRTYVSFSKDAKTAFNKLCSSLGVSHIVKMKQKVTKLTNVNENEEEDSETKPEKKKKKQKSSKEKLKLKKEAKSLRLQSLSEGFSSKIDFSENNKLEDIKEDEDVEMEEIHQENKKDKKRKKENSITEEITTPKLKKSKKSTQDSNNDKVKKKNKKKNTI